MARYVIALIFLISIVWALTPHLLPEEHTATDAETAKDDRQTLAHYGLTTDTTKYSIPLTAILSGGPGKDGIPALTDPAFVSLEETEVQDTVRGILLDIQNTRRFYPFSILVWHEIVNDSIEDTVFAVTYCPLCDTALTINRRIGGTPLQFGVSGLLYESNLLMYDTATESLWSQTRREAVVGTYTGTTLSLLPQQILTLGEVRSKYPDTVVLSTATGYRRDYTHSPYADYADREETLFPFSKSDAKFSAKEPLYVIPFRGASVAFPFNDFSEGTQEFTINNETLIITRTGDEIIAVTNGKQIPGYTEFWFSWITHHTEDGVVLTVE